MDYTTNQQVTEPVQNPAGDTNLAAKEPASVDAKKPEPAKEHADLEKAGKDWFKKSVIYQIYPQSFCDSNDDGIGDLKGIESRLPYLQKLGADVIWLNPIFVSPLVDNGYDIADYRKINPMYGTLEDFQSLLKAAHDHGIRIILDLVVNHTSDQHPWFLDSKSSKDGEYADFYIWKDPKEDGSEPNNWGSTFGGPAWTYVPERNQYYLHCFAPGQPDLNWENPRVRQAVYDEMRYWLDMGVDGFRMDVISLLSKDQSWPDNDGSFAYTKSYYMGASNGPRIHEFLHEMNQEVLSHYDVMTVGETPNTNTAQALLFTKPEREELNMVFQFDHMHLDYGKYGKFSNARFDLRDLKNSLSQWENELEEGWNSLYWNNHDQPRTVSRFGNDEKYRVESAKMLGTALHMLKGTPFVFEGEEIGMRNVPFPSLNEYKDIETLYFIEDLRKAGESEEEIAQICKMKSRDNARTPMPWNGRKEEGYGFSRHEPWIAYSPDNESIHVEAALNDPDSIFYHYQNLIRLRKELPIVVEGDYRLLDAEHPEVYLYERNLDGQKLVVLCSFADHDLDYTLPKELEGYEGNLVLSNYKNSAPVLPRKMILRPYEALIYLSK